MENTEQDLAASANSADASLREAVGAWEKVFQGLKIRFRTNIDLVAAEANLSLKALAIALLSIIAMVGVMLLIWVTIQVAMALIMWSFQLHWGWTIGAIILTNLILLNVLKKILSSALSSVSMSESTQSLFSLEPK